MSSPSAQDHLCVLPLSSPYSLLPRTHMYAMLVALLLPLPRGWLWRAALAGFTTKTAVFAVDAAVHLTDLRQHHDDVGVPLPLDVLACLEMLALASMVAVWLLVVSRTASVSAARGLMRAWALSVAVGCVVAFVGVKTLAGMVDVETVVDGNPAGPVCAEKHAVLMPKESIFGDHEEHFTIGTYPSRIGRFMLTSVGITGLVFASLTLISITSQGPGQKISTKPASVKATLDLESISLPPEITGPRQQEGHNKLVRLARYFLALAIPANAIFVICFAERYFLEMAPAGIPETEPLSSVGQWGVWAATGVVLLGTFVNAVKEKAGLNEKEVVVGELGVKNRTRVG